jgi:hypothetical protein
MDSWFLEAEETAVKAFGGRLNKKKSGREVFPGWFGWLIRGF